MGECMLCNKKTGLMGSCKNCGLDNNLSTLKKDSYSFVFKGNKVYALPAKDKTSIKDFCKKNQEKVRAQIKEKQMESIGYYKGKMCPFTQVKVGGSQNVASAVLFGAPMYNEFTWTHGECLEEYCAIWDNKNKRCSILTIASKK